MLRPEETRDAHDLDNARRLVEAHGEDLRYCPDWGKWLHWDGVKWSIDGGGEVRRRMMAVAGTLPDLADAKVVTRAQSARAGSNEGMNAAIAVAKDFPGICVHPSSLDADASILNAPNGIVDLRTGKLLPNDRERLCTKIAGCEYDEGFCGRGFVKFLGEVLRGDMELMKFVRIAAGYSITGEVSAQCLMFLYGLGANGKSLLLELLRQAAGTYACVAAPGLLLDAGGDDHPTGVADLCGKRLVITSEAGEGKKLAEELVKRLTGADTIKARYMRQDFWEFAPTHKLWMAANHKPSIRGTDEGIWRRIHLIPFTARFRPQEDAIPGDLVRDDGLLKRLIGEDLPSVLTWMVTGAECWYKHGLRPPEVVAEASREYRDEQDTFGAFLRDIVEEAAGGKVAGVEFRAAYDRWCELNGEKYPLGRKQFSQELVRRGFQQEDGNQRRWLGVRLAEQPAWCPRAAE